MSSPSDDWFKEDNEVLSTRPSRIKDHGTTASSTSLISDVLRRPWPAFIDTLQLRKELSIAMVEMVVLKRQNILLEDSLCEAKWHSRDV